jgi:hypothetical protein
MVKQAEKAKRLQPLPDTLRVCSSLQGMYVLSLVAEN